MPGLVGPPVSNLTNLIAIAEGRLDAGELVLHLALPTSWPSPSATRLAGRLPPPTAPPVAPAVAERPSPRALFAGAVVLAVLLAGFLPGRLLGIEPWMVVAVVDAGLMVLARTVPWRSIPWGTAAVAGGLAVVAAAAAQRAGAAHWLVAGGTWEQALRGAAAANLLNNLPAFLVALPRTTGTDQVLALLFGVNVGPTVLVTGSLAGLLWLDAARRHGLGVGARDYARIGLVAGIPALLGRHRRPGVGVNPLVPRLDVWPRPPCTRLAGGLPFFTALVDHFYDGVAADPEPLALYPQPDDLGPARHRLTLFLAEYWVVPRPTTTSGAIPGCGPGTSPSPSATPSGTGGGADMRAAVAAMDPPPDIAEALLSYFTAAADAMRNTGLSITVPGRTGGNAGGSAAS